MDAVFDYGDYGSALAAAADHGLSDVVRYLLDVGADTSIPGASRCEAPRQSPWSIPVFSPDLDPATLIESDGSLGTHDSDE